MELESPQQPRVTRVSDTERETAVGLLQRAAGEGRLRLEEFSDRVGIALAADTIEQLESATAGIDKTPELPSAGPVSSLVAVLGDRRQVGRHPAGGSGSKAAAVAAVSATSFRAMATDAARRRC